MSFFCKERKVLDAPLSTGFSRKTSWSHATCFEGHCQPHSMASESSKLARYPFFVGRSRKSRRAERATDGSASPANGSARQVRKKKAGCTEQPAPPQRKGELSAHGFPCFELSALWSPSPGGRWYHGLRENTRIFYPGNLDISALQGRFNLEQRIVQFAEIAAYPHV